MVFIAARFHRRGSYFSACIPVVCFGFQSRRILRCRFTEGPILVPVLWQSHAQGRLHVRNKLGLIRCQIQKVSCSRCHIMYEFACVLLTPIEGVVSCMNLHVYCLHQIEGGEFTRVPDSAGCESSSCGGWSLACGLKLLLVYEGGSGAGGILGGQCR